MLPKFVSPKLLIIDYYDWLINQIDIYTEELLEKFTDQDVLPNLSYESDASSSSSSLSSLSTDMQSANEDLNITNLVDSYVDPYSDDFTHYVYNSSGSEDLSPLSSPRFMPGCTRVKDYLNSVRANAIDEIKKAQEENIDLYESIRNSLNTFADDIVDAEKVEELRSKLFANRFCFLIKIDDKGCSNRNESMFKMCTVVLDFYMNENEVNLLKKFCEFLNSRNIKDLDSKPNIILNQKTLLIHLLSKYIRINYAASCHYGNTVIRVNRDLLTSQIDKISLHHTNVKIKEVCLNDCMLEFACLKSFNLDPGYRMLEVINLDGLVNLEYLSLTHTSLNCNEILTNLLNLRKLVLYECAFSSSTTTTTTTTQLEDQTCQLFAKLPSLEVLEVFRPDHFNFLLTELTNLKWLNLRKVNELNVDLFKTITNELVLLNLSNNTINNVLAESLFQNLNTPKLIKLNLARNQLSTLEGHWFTKLNHLRELILESNQIVEINLNQFDCLENLEILDLHGNSIEVLKEDTFKPLKNLKILYLGDNPIKKFEVNVFRGLNRLEKLYLVSIRNEEFVRITDNFFTGLTNLRLLKLNFNYLSSIDAKGFDCLENLRELDLSRNRVQLNISTFAKLTSLKCLDLSRNGFEDIGENVFLNLSRLERLNLAYNNLKRLNLNTFNGLSSLKDLNLSFNDMNNFSVDVLDEMPKLEKVNFKYNPFEDYENISTEMNKRDIKVII